MSNRATSAVGGARTNVADAPAHGVRRTSVIETWYARGAAVLWSTTNIAAALAATIVSSGHVATAALVAWLVFTATNAAAYSALERMLGRDQAQAAAGRLALAAVFGLSWGALFLLAAPALPAEKLVVIALLGLLVAVSAIGVFGVHRGAYTLFAVPLVAAATPALNANAAITGAGVYTLPLFVFLMLLAAAYGRFARTAVRALGLFTDIARNDHDADGHDPAMMFDLHARRLRRLRRERDRSRATLGAITEAVITVTEAGLIDYMNPIAEVLTGIEIRQANGQSVDKVVRLCDHGAQTRMDRLLAQPNARQAFESEGERVRLQRNDGVEYEIEYRIATLVNAADGPDGKLVLLRDITEQRQLMEKAAWLATHDPLTMLLSQAEFEQQLAHAIAGHADTDARDQSMCYIDLDQFRYLADAHGIEDANRTLAAIADALRQRTREDDVLGRIGEDRFGLLLNDCSLDKANLIAGAMKDVISELRVDSGNDSIAVTASIGVIGIGAAGDDTSRVLARARAACLRAKTTGGDAVVTIDERDQAERFRLASRRRLLEIRSAIESGDLELYYQPMLRLREEVESRACELLVRLADPVSEFLLPREFLVTEEHLALLPRLDRWIVTASAAALTDEHGALSGMDTIFVTISGESINDDRFLEHISQTFEGIRDRSRLCFTISEAGSISEVERARYFVARLYALGCRVALDNFGVGIGSFALLKRLQVDYLKINTETTMNMPHNSVDYEIILATSRIAKALGVETVAEGVTTHAARQTLFGLGIDYALGLIGGRPRPVAEPAVLADTIP